jgi:hypothetical protein
MSESELASPGRRAAVELVLRHGRSYASASEASAVPTALVRRLAQRALVDRAPFSAARVDPEWREPIVDYVLGQQADDESAATREYLSRSEAARSWALLLVDSLTWLHDNGRRPVIPTGPARADGAALHSPPPTVRRRPAPLGGVPRVRFPRPTAPPALADVISSPLASIVVPVLVALCAAALWAVSLREVDVTKVTDLGLISALPSTVILSLLVLSASFCICLRRRPLSTPVLLLHVGILILILFGTAAIVEQEPRFNAAWRHVGIADSILRTGHIDASIDAYFNWPGFFILTAFLTNVAGLHNALTFLAWAPVFYNLLFLAPLFMIMRSGTLDRRHLWLGVWIFYLANWIGQDYFSPQATTYFIYLVVLALIVTWFKAEDGGKIIAWLGRTRPLARARSFLSPDRARVEEPVAEPLSPPARMAVMGVVIFLFLFTIPAHQLTPFALITALGTLVVLDLCKARSLAVLMVVVAGAWISYLTVGYLTGHFQDVIGRVGQIQESANQNVSHRITGSADHIFIVHLRLYMTAALWGIAVLGALRRLLHGHREWVYMALAVAPFPLFAFQPYGGEVIIRVYFFALPFMAFFAAGLFYSTMERGRSWWITGAAFLATAALIGTFFYTRYGNERSDAFTTDDVVTAQRLYQISPKESAFLAGSGNVPWRYREYEEHTYQYVTEFESWKLLRIYPTRINAVVREIRNYMADSKTGAYLIFTRSEKAYVEILDSSPRGSLEKIEATISRSPDFRLVYKNGEGRIFTLSQQGKR